MEEGEEMKSIEHGNLRQEKTWRKGEKGHPPPPKKKPPKKKKNQAPQIGGKQNGGLAQNVLLERGDVQSVEASPDLNLHRIWLRRTGYD